MKTTLKTKPLLAAVTALYKVIPTRSMTPILENIHAEAVPGGFRLTASDLETTMVTLIPENETTGCKVVEEGVICVPARFLLDMLKQVESETITVECGDGDAVVTLGWENGRSQLPGMDRNDYPETAKEIAGGVSFDIPGETLLKALTATAYACSDDDIRPALKGVLFDLSPDGTTLVATDSHRLIIHELPDVKVTDKTNFILPKKQAGIIKSLCTEGETVHVEMNGDNAAFRFADTTIALRGCTGRYPNYRSVIPKDLPNRLTADRAALVAALKRISVCANRTSLHIKMTFVPDIMGAKMILTAEDNAYGIAAKEESAAEYTGEQMSVGFKAPFLIDILGNLEGGQVDLALLDHRHSVLISPAGEEGETTTKAILMPISI